MRGTGCINTLIETAKQCIRNISVNCINISLQINPSIESSPSRDEWFSMTVRMATAASKVSCTICVCYTVSGGMGQLHL